jgi:methanogenic corrinoid protein MtbC1
MIGLVCLEQLLVEDGWSGANLGADLPAEDLGVFVARNDVALVALSAMDGARVGALADAVQAVRDAAGDRPIGAVVGGGISSIPGLKDTIQADGVAHSLTEAVELARAHRPG